MKTTLDLQRRLAALGYNPGPLDGSPGSMTREATKAFQRDRGLTADGVAGKLTWAALDSGFAPKPGDADPITPPWVDEMMRRKGLHEQRDFAELQAWLKSAGSAVNPKTTPWCGDAVETAILRALPDEPMPANPMASINWLKFGVEMKTPALGCVLVFWRGAPTGWAGHVGFYVGESATHYHVLGGNQSDAITITKIRKQRLRDRGMRWPRGYPLPTGGRIVANGDGLMVTENEA